VIRALVIVVLLGMATVAHATPTPMITAPKGWTQDPEHAAAVTTKLAELTQLGGEKVVLATEVWVPKLPGIALVITRITAQPVSGKREDAARAAIEDLHASGPTAYAWNELPSSVDRAIVARGEWTDATLHTQTVGTVVIAASADRLVAVRGECFTADGIGAPEATECVQALASLDPGIPVAERIAFEAAPRGAPATDPVTKRDEPARLTDGQQIHLQPITISQAKPEADRRPVYLGAGIVVLAGIFWWNRKRREKFEREDGTATAKPTRRETSDDDAEDLAAAARGDARKDDEA